MAVVGGAERRSASGRSVLVACLSVLVLAPLSACAAVVGTAGGWNGGMSGGLGWICLTLVWAVAGAILLLRPGGERLGALAIWVALLAGVAVLAAAGSGDASALLEALTIALLPAAVLHVLLVLPDGSLSTGEDAVVVGAAYLVAASIGVLTWTQRPSLPAWPAAIEAAVAAGVGVNSVASRYTSARFAKRRRMDWTILSLALALEVALVGFTLHILIGWPPHVLEIAAAATLPIPLGLLLARSKRFQGAAPQLLVHAIPLAGLTALVAGAYLLVIGWLGHSPTQTQQTLVVLSIVAAVLSAMLYVPVSKRLAMFANQVVHGSRQSPDEVMRSFGAHLSRSVPLEELLLRLAESLRRSLALEAAEIWIGSGGRLERVASDPDRDPAWIRLTAAEEMVVAQAGVSGPAWAAVWVPQLVESRGDAAIRIAPLSHAGELYGLMVAERAAESPPLDQEAEGLLEELARQVGLTLRNARLDSQLQASLDELRGQADELRASRARVVAAADAERRRIERDLHDGAQQYLAGLATNLRVVRGLVESDPGKAGAILDELDGSTQQAQEALRDLAHGIYPPLLQDQGLPAALANAARGASIATRVEATISRRFDPEVEATVYFCCREALQNAGKHAGKRARATVRVWEEAGSLLFEIADDGVGLAPELAKHGAGFTNMRDRLGAIGGRLRLESAAGRGTRVLGAIPI